MKRPVSFLFCGAFLATGVLAARAQEIQVPALDDFGGGAGLTIESPLRTCIIPSIEFQRTPLEDALDFLRQKSVELDAHEPDPLRKGVNIVLKTPPGWSSGAVSLNDEETFSFSDETNSPVITLTLKNAPLGDAIRYVAEIAGLEMRIEAHAIVLAPPPDDVVSLIGSLEATVKRLANGEEGRMPATLFESLQSEYRVMEAQEDRLKSQGVPADDSRRVALAAKLVKTEEKIEEARELLKNFLSAEKALAEEWIEEVGD